MDARRAAGPIRASTPGETSWSITTTSALRSRRAAFQGEQIGVARAGADEVDLPLFMLVLPPLSATAAGSATAAATAAAAAAARVVVCAACGLRHEDEAVLPRLEFDEIELGVPAAAAAGAVAISTVTPSGEQRRVFALARLSKPYRR